MQIICLGRVRIEPDDRPCSAGVVVGEDATGARGYTVKRHAGLASGHAIVIGRQRMGRFRARLTDPLKRWKLSYEDFRNHARWRDYEAAIEDMVETTSTKRAPWHLVPANNKPFGRLAAFRIIADRLSKHVALEPRALDPKVAAAAEQLLGIKPPPDNHREH